MKTLLLFVLCAGLAGAQSKPAHPAPAKPAQAAESAAEPAAPNPSPEAQDLERALGEAGGSPVEYARALERHLRKYPASERRAELVRVIAQAAADLRDKRRLLSYGVQAIEDGARNPQLLDQVTRALLDKDDPPSSERALRYARLLADSLQAQSKSLLESKELPSARGRRLDETEYALARALNFQARALGNLGQFDEAVTAATRGWELCPTAEGARERARWLERAGKFRDALAAYAESVSITDERSAGDPARDRTRLAELATKANGAESAFGDALLTAYDRTVKLEAGRQARLRQFDSNYGARTPQEFTLSKLDGTSLAMSSLKGKVVILDFWATWCGPCRGQHPLYEQVKQRYQKRDDVVFLAVSTDEDRAAVKPFLVAQKWSPEVYFEDGLAVLLRISSIPTTIMLDKSGAVMSRLNGYIPDRFVQMLSERIDAALEEN